jgi:hypothetical protein
MQSTDLTLHAIASKEHVTPGYISRLLRLPLLARDIVTAFVNGKNRRNSPQPPIGGANLQRLPALVR